MTAAIVVYAFAGDPDNFNSGGNGLPPSTPTPDPWHRWKELGLELSHTLMLAAVSLVNMLALGLWFLDTSAFPWWLVLVPTLLCGTILKLIVAASRRVWKVSPVEALFLEHMEQAATNFGRVTLVTLLLIPYLSH